MKYQKTMLFLLTISLFGCSKDIAENEKKKDANPESVSTESGSLSGQLCEKKEDCKDDEYCLVGVCESDYPECSSGADCMIGSACIMNTDDVCDGCLGKNLCFVDSFCDEQDFDLTCDMGTIPRAEDDFGTHDLVAQDSSFVD